MNSPRYSKIDDADWKYPQGEPYHTGTFKTDDEPAHKIAYSEYGRPDGEPVIVVHGGPGGGSAPFMMRYFDPDKYRIILFDQRGCGKSTPSVADNPDAGLHHNTTAHLINDIDKLRDVCGIRKSEKTHIFGGSWGTTLGLAYAIARPDYVKSLVLRGIFLASEPGLAYQYQGNATTYEPYEPALNEKSTPEEVTRFMQHFNRQPTEEKGNYRAYSGKQGDAGVIPTEHHYPGMAEGFARAWDEFVRVIPKGDRHDMVAAYSRILEKREPMTNAERTTQTEALRAWTKWEDVSSYLYHDLTETGKLDDPKNQKAFAMIENHYFMNGCFMGGGRGDKHRDNRWILDNVAKIKDIPTYIVHGKYDQVAPISEAHDLVKELHKVGNIPAFEQTNAGHSMAERETALALTKRMDEIVRNRTIPDPNYQPTKVVQERLKQWEAQRQAEQGGGHGGPA